MRTATLLACATLAAASPAHALCALHMVTFADVASATDTAGLPKAALDAGRPTKVELVPVATIHFPVHPTKSDGPYAGLLAFDAPSAGSYRISLGARAWIDVVEGQATIASIDHHHGTPCSGVTKEVVFPLTAGRHAIEITGSAAPTLAIRMTPAT